MSSLRNRLYYLVKPYMPRPVRMALRRMQARRVRAACGDTWPIDPAAARPPAGWTGWPDGKQFAVVLTHDVEGQRGLDRCARLAEVERQFGFRSSFYFIPEGEYRVSDAFREALVRDGFEVGVHDLHHDGRLYSSRRIFTERAARINEYLKTWGAVGFRSGFMLRNLDWIGELDIEYDASTFDTDPFEPQPDGVHSIYPFVIDRADGRPGYVELPYTLVQDSTLFLLLREPDCAIWKRKVDWLAERGGMVLLNLHPDYVRFDESDQGGTTYPIAHYEELLQYLNDTYTGRFWAPLARDVASWSRGQRTPRVPPSVTTAA